MRPRLAPPALRARIARAMGDLYGCAPVETFLDQDLVVCTHQQTFALEERAPLDHELIDAIEGLTCRPVAESSMPASPICA